MAQSEGPRPLEDDIPSTVFERKVYEFEGQSQSARRSHCFEGKRDRSWEDGGQQSSSNL